MPYFELVRHIIRTEGWQRLYRGMPSAISGTGLSWALYFGCANLILALPHSG